MIELKPHPIADVFPLLRGEKFDVLVRDIKERGVDIPIVLYQDLILDGRNRYRACFQLGIECPSIVYDGDDPWDKVIALNVHRRQLTAGATAIAAAKAANMPVGRPDKDNNHNYDDLSLPIKDAVGKFNISHNTINLAKRVNDSGRPELIDLCLSDDLAISAAAYLLDNFTADEVTVLLEQDVKEIKQAIAAKRQEQNATTRIQEELAKRRTAEAVEAERAAAERAARLQEVLASVLDFNALENFSSDAHKAAFQRCVLHENNSKYIPKSWHDDVAKRIIRDLGSNISSQGIADWINNYVAQIRQNAADSVEKNRITIEIERRAANIITSSLTVKQEYEILSKTLTNWQHRFEPPYASLTECIKILEELKNINLAIFRKSQ